MRRPYGNTVLSCINTSLVFDLGGIARELGRLVAGYRTQGEADRSKIHIEYSTFMMVESNDVIRSVA